MEQLEHNMKKIIMKDIKAATAHLQSSILDDENLDTDRKFLIE